MRPSRTAGLILVIVGVATLALGGSFPGTREALRIGDLRVTTEVRRPISPWIATVAILVGTVLLVTGAGDRSAKTRW
ncbi:MAG: hypothetical protein IPJ78_10585 [Gemmatimonadetes bacterium]|jgi:hypothetical protein|nr:hypothetical protein [Gemmatimonadota bacterium]MBP7551124.1 hypothetical protein [Gemmatimonadaceae bacterium]